jgi:hypothetical protein
MVIINMFAVKFLINRHESRKNRHFFHKRTASLE